MAEALVIQKQGFLSSRNVGVIVVQDMLGTVRVCATLVVMFLPPHLVRAVSAGNDENT